MRAPHPGPYGSWLARIGYAPGGPEDGREKWFCGECGSSLFSSKPGFADPIGVRMGAFDEDPGIRPSARFFVAYAAPWEAIPDDGLPRFPERRQKPRF